MVKNPSANAGDAGDVSLIPGSGRSPGEGSGNPLQYSCLENPTDGGAWWAIVHGVTKSRTRLSDFTFFDHTSVNITTRRACFVFLKMASVIEATSPSVGEGLCLAEEHPWMVQA